jgi:hypothetical protein
LELPGAGESLLRRRHSTQGVEQVNVKAESLKAGDQILIAGIKQMVVALGVSPYDSTRKAVLLRGGAYVSLYGGERFNRVKP